MAMVDMELAPRGCITLWIKVVGLLRPFDNDSRTFHDGFKLHGLNIEVILWDTSAVDMGCRVITRPSGRYVEWVMFVVYWSSLWSHRVRLR